MNPWFGILIANCIPLVGVIYFGWSAESIVVSYWIEMGVAGLFIASKINRAVGTVINPGITTARFLGKSIDPTTATPREISSFFVKTYYLLWIAYGVVLAIFLNDRLSLINPIATAITIATLTVNHFLALLRWIDLEKWKDISPSQQFVNSFGSVFVLHIFLILGGAAIGESIWAFILFVATKLVIDLLGIFSKQQKENTPEEIAYVKNPEIIYRKPKKSISMFGIVVYITGAAAFIIFSFMHYESKPVINKELYTDSDWGISFMYPTNYRVVKHTFNAGEPSQFTQIALFSSNETGSPEEIIAARSASGEAAPTATIYKYVPGQNFELLNLPREKIAVFEELRLEDLFVGGMAVDDDSQPTVEATAINGNKIIWAHNPEWSYYIAGKGSDIYFIYLNPNDSPLKSIIETFKLDPKKTAQTLSSTSMKDLEISLTITNPKNIRDIIVNGTTLTLDNEMQSTTIRLFNKNHSYYAQKMNAARLATYGILIPGNNTVLVHTTLSNPNEESSLKIGTRENPELLNIQLKEGESTYSFFL